MAALPANLGGREATMIDAAAHGSIRTLSRDDMISSRVARTGHVRVKFPRCRTRSTVQSSVTGGLTHMDAGKGSNVPITMAG
jgi:hypothetical protein